MTDASLHKLLLRSLAFRSRSNWYPSAAIGQIQRSVLRYRAFLFVPQLFTSTQAVTTTPLQK